MKASGLTRFLVTVLCLLLGLSSRQADASGSKPPLPRIAVAPFRIEPQPFPGAPSRQDLDVITRHLAAEATAQAVRTLRERGYAKDVEIVARPPEATAPIVICGVVKLPVALPPHIAGVDAGRRHGAFATGQVTLVRTDGTVVATGSVRLGWGAVWWIAGGPKDRRLAPLDAVLADFARKAADRLVRQVAGRDPSAATP
ncbi:MAG: hypothetical protein JO250_17290 [Armatimonadetes bacterium]|nr:hypothetical protein [Armatimonadota bacterium]